MGPVFLVPGMTMVLGFLVEISKILPRDAHGTGLPRVRDDRGAGLPREEWTS